MNRRKLFWIASSGLTLVIVGIGLLYALNIVGADTSAIEPIAIKDYSAEVGYKPNTLYLQSQKAGRKIEHRLVKRTGIFKKTLILEGFEEKVYSCREKNIEYNEAGALCLIGSVGAHSFNLQIVLPQTLSPLSFRLAEGAVANNIYSDLPLFTFEDSNGDGTPDLAAYNRNYDTNPLERAIKNYYLRTKDGFLFERSEEIEYN